MSTFKIVEGLQSEASEKTPILAEFLKQDPSERGHWLSLRPFQAALSLLDVWVNSPEFRLTDAFAIADQNWRQHALDRVAGSSSKGIKGISRPFILAPAYEGDVIFVEFGTQKGRTQHKKIEAPTRLNVREACLVMAQYGPTTPVDVNVNRVVELDEAGLSSYAPTPLPDNVLEIFFPKEWAARKKAAESEAIVDAISQTTEKRSRR